MEHSGKEGEASGIKRGTKQSQRGQREAEVADV